MSLDLLVFGPHPDDIESWCAGTLARAIDAGATVRLVLVTSGDKGSNDRTANPAEVAAQREREAQDAAQVLGIEEVTFLRYPDGEVEDVPALRRELVARIRAARPEIVFTHDPEQPYPPYLSHRDHRIVGRATLELWQGGIGSTVRRADTGGVRVSVSPRPGRLVVALTASAGALTSMSADLARGGTAVEVKLEQPVPEVDPGNGTRRGPPGRTPRTQTFDTG